MSDSCGNCASRESCYGKGEKCNDFVPVESETNVACSDCDLNLKVRTKGACEKCITEHFNEANNPNLTKVKAEAEDAMAIVEMPKETILAMCDRIEELEKENEYYETRSVPAGTPPIVCLCGSTRFMDAFFEAGWQFTLQGEIVLSVGVCKHAEDHGGEALGQDVADKLDELHFRKIDLADRVFVLNVDGYIGDSTRKEIEYAASKDKPIQYLEALKQKGNSNGK